MIERCYYRCPSCGRNGHICPCKYCEAKRTRSPETGNLLCNSCSQDVVVFKWFEENRFPFGEFIVLKLHDDPRKKKSATWYFHRGEVSFRCWACGSLNGMPKSEVDHTGHTRLRVKDRRRCFECKSCGQNKGLYFKGWDETVHGREG